MAGKMLVLEDGCGALAKGGEVLILKESANTCRCCRCVDVTVNITPTEEDAVDARAVHVVLSDKTITCSVDDMAVVSPEPASISRCHLSASAGFVLGANYGNLGSTAFYCVRNGFSVSIGGQTYFGGGSGQTGAISTSEYNAGCAAAGLRVVHSGGFISKEELKAMGFKTGTWHVSLVTSGMGHVNATIRCA